jgi:hypothetical protein
MSTKSFVFDREAFVNKSTAVPPASVSRQLRSGRDLYIQAQPRNRSRNPLGHLPTGTNDQERHGKRARQPRPPTRLDEYWDGLGAGECSAGRGVCL